MTKRFLLCEPRYYDVQYAINPWMDVQEIPDHAIAMSQWKNLCEKITTCGGTLLFLEPTPGQPDMIFTANAGLVRGNRCALSHFRHSERQGEEEGYCNWFIENGYEILQLEGAEYFEGEGSALFAGDTLFCGYGIRSVPEAYHKILPFLEIEKSIECEMVDPRFYHLDTCFAPINESLAIYFPAAFSEKSQKAIAEAIEVIEVPEEEAVCFACNAIVIENQIIIPEGCPKTYRALETRGYEIHPVPMDQFLLAGGAAKCSVLMLDH